MYCLNEHFVSIDEGTRFLVRFHNSPKIMDSIFEPDKPL